MTFEEDLIAKVRANEVLYNVKNVNYRRKNDKERLWQQIAYELNCSGKPFPSQVPAAATAAACPPGAGHCPVLATVQGRKTHTRNDYYVHFLFFLPPAVEVCKRRWKSLRDKFIKLSRAEQAARGTSDEEQPKKWRYFDSLSFLQGYNKASL